MDQKLAKWIVYAYAALFALGALFTLVMFVPPLSAAAWTNVPLLVVFAFLLVANAATSAGLFLRRHWGRMLALLVCGIGVLLVILLTLRYGARSWEGTDTTILMLSDLLFGAFGIYAFGCDKDVKALFVKNKRKV